jgi:hypothetical protein
MDRPSLTSSYGPASKVFEGGSQSRVPSLPPSLQHSRTPTLQLPEQIKITSKIKIKKRQGGGKMSRVGHGLARVVSRVEGHKRPVFIDLSRCHGSGPLKAISCSPAGPWLLSAGRSSSCSSSKVPTERLEAQRFYELRDAGSKCGMTTEHNFRFSDRGRRRGRGRYEYRVKPC